MSIGEREIPLTGTALAPASGWAAIRPLLLRLHFYAGVFVGPFLLIAALTGIAYIHMPQLEQALHAQELHVPAALGVIWGCRMWWYRRPTRGQTRFGRPPLRGTWRRVPGRVLAPLFVGAAMIGYFLPVLDVLLCLRKREVVS
jgi:uncharacterized iron-regulated membrane protein